MTFQTGQKKWDGGSISFCFWNVWLFNHKHGHSLGIWASTKKLRKYGREKERYGEWEKNHIYM